MNKLKSHELIKRLTVTTLILVVYFFGRSILLIGIDAAAYDIQGLDPQNIMNSILAGDRYQYTVLALGIMPYITSSLCVSIFLTLKGKEFRSHISENKQERWQLILTLIFAFITAITNANSLIFVKDSNISHEWLKIISVVEMVAGAMLVYYMAKCNKERGIGEQSPFILLNLIDSIIRTVRGHEVQDIFNVIPACILVSIIIFVMDNVIIKTPVQRVSIHNEYAKESYIGFKLNPMGVMPVMFAITFFNLPQMIAGIGLYFDKDNVFLQNISQQLSLNEPVGVIVYLVIIFILSVLLPFVFLSPNNIADELQKGGDSIVGVYAGKKTRRYLSRRLFVLCVSSGLILCFIMGASLYFSLAGQLLPELALFPSTAMFVFGNISSVFDEITTYGDYDSYRFFI